MWKSWADQQHCHAQSARTRPSHPDRDSGNQLHGSRLSTQATTERKLPVDNLLTPAKNGSILKLMPWTYILQCNDGSYYVGSTMNLDERMDQHAMGGGAAYTRQRLPVVLVWSEKFERIDEAWAIERRLHGWSRAKKQALIEGRFEHLPGLSSRARKNTR